MSSSVNAHPPCPNCGIGRVVEYAAKATGERFWLCEECDSLWRPGQDRTAMTDLDLYTLFPNAVNAWALIERAAPAPAGPSALVALCRDGEFHGLRLGMARDGALLVADPEHTHPRTDDGAEFEDVTLAFAGGRLTGITARPRPGGMRLPGIMASAAGEPLTVLPAAAARKELHDAGLEDLGADHFRGEHTTGTLTFHDGLLTEVTVVLDR